MAVISVRFNEKGSKILNMLTAKLEIDQSTLIKKSIMDTYEDQIDRQVIVAAPIANDGNTPITAT